MRHPLEEGLLKGGKADGLGPAQRLATWLAVEVEVEGEVEVEAEPGDGAEPTEVTPRSPAKGDSEEDRAKEVMNSLVVAVGLTVLGFCLFMAFVRVLLGDEAGHLVFMVVVCINFVFHCDINVSLARVERTSPLIVSVLALAAILVSFFCPPRGSYPVFTQATCLTLATGVTISCLALCAHVARAKRYRKVTEQVKRHYFKFFIGPLFVGYISLALLLIAGIIGENQLYRSYAALLTIGNSYMVIMCTQIRLAGRTGADEFANEAAKWTFLTFGIVFLIFLSFNWPVWY